MTNAQGSTINWDRAIARNRDALLRILAALFVMTDLAEGATAATMSRYLHNHILRILRAAESAVRRLIVIAARDLVVVVAPRKQPTTPSTTTTTTTTTSVPAFTGLPLLDPRKRFDFRPRRRCAKSFPRITFIGLTEPTPIPEDWIPSPDDAIDATRLRRRLAGLKRALDDIPGQAKRLARWKAKRDLGLNRSKYFSPMRPGWPPGRRKRAFHEVDDVLAECHALALSLEREDTS
ncbi:hypothetical protein [Oricola nitratireducens]|uniref:hypothetical protein n=1 Tax=Oricola nitratireducens TaxID=2775868 RepID=UPI001867203A|nr:hypothetical protein [Oricola nitratireducens]